jgi:hypothetical protein
MQDPDASKGTCELEYAASYMPAYMPARGSTFLLARFTNMEGYIPNEDLRPFTYTNEHMCIICNLHIEGLHHLK